MQRLFFRQLPSNERRGTILVLTAVLMVVLLGFVAMTVDVGFIELTRTQLQSAADAGALAGAMELSATDDPALVRTNAKNAILQTAALVVSGADTIYVTENREIVSTLFEKQIFNGPLTFWIGIVMAFIFWAVLRYTVLGQNMTAMGKNELAATLSAVPTSRVRIIAYALSGFMGGLAGLSIVAQSGSASASGLGSDLLLPALQLP